MGMLPILRQPYGYAAKFKATSMGMLGHATKAKGSFYRKAAKAKAAFIGRRPNPRHTWVNATKAKACRSPPAKAKACT